MAELQPSQGERPLILLIENDDADVFLFRRALGKLNYHCDVRVVGSVSEARAYMENIGAYEDSSYYRRPYLIVSDFRLAGITALEFVRWLRQDSRHRELPLVILSGAVRADDVPRLTEAGVEKIIHKTADVTELAERLEPFLPLFWIGLVANVILSCAA